VLCQILALRAVDKVWAIYDEDWDEGMFREVVILLVTSALPARVSR